MFESLRKKFSETSGKLTKKLENELRINDLSYQMINEYYLVDTGLYRIYEIKMEEFKYE